MTILKQCPFCGAAAKEFYWRNHFGCSNEQCGAYAANITAEQWNRRPLNEGAAGSLEAAGDRRDWDECDRIEAEGEKDDRQQE